MELTTSITKCLSKRSFTNEREAIEEMEFLKVSKEYRKLKRAYKCDLCNKWHLTKLKKINGI